MSEATLIELMKIRNSRGENYLHKICQIGSLSLLQRAEKFLQANHQELVNERNYEGLQPIHVIIQHQTGQIAVQLIEQLIRMGADVNGTENLRGNTPLILAVLHDDHILVDWLCDQPTISMDATNWARKTAYQIAWAKKAQQMTEILRDRGADTRTSDYAQHSDSDSDES